MGIYKVVRNGKELYRARISVSGKRKSLGYHKTAELAEIAIATYRQQEKRNQSKQAFTKTVTPLVVGSSITVAQFDKGVNTFIDETHLPEQPSSNITFNDKLVARPFVIRKPSLLNSIKQLFHK